MINKEKIAVFGLGKLGASMAGVFADTGFKVNAFDIDIKKVELINSGKAPVYETGLNEIIKKNSTIIKGYTNCKDILKDVFISFVIVPTPSRDDGTFETKYAENVAELIGEELKNLNHYHVVVLTSTVLPGDSRKKIISKLEEFSNKICGKDFGFCYSPEFIALGSVINDLKTPDYFLIGEYDNYSGDELVYVNKKVASKDPEICRMKIEEAELAKIATNSYITQKITFANYISAICSKIEGANANVVTNAIGTDSRIGKKYLNGGMSYGGPCFPRDNRALSKYSDSIGIKSEIPFGVDKFNKEYAAWIVSRVSDVAPGFTKVGVVGLSYKPGSHLIEESPSFGILESLLSKGHEVSGFDYLSNEFEISINSNNFKTLEKVRLQNSLASIIESCEVLIFAHNDKLLGKHLLEMIQKLNKSITIVDCWKILERDTSNKISIKYL
jgi:UDPglucose 6-dehydrogenase